MNNGFVCVFLYLIGGSFVGAFLTGNGMRFDGLRFFTLLGFSGGVLSLLDFAWFAHSGSNLDYSLTLLAIVVALDFIFAFGRKSE